MRRAEAAGKTPQRLEKQRRIYPPLKAEAARRGQQRGEEGAWHKQGSQGVERVAPATETALLTSICPDRRRGGGGATGGSKSRIFCLILVRLSLLNQRSWPGGGGAAAQKTRQQVPGERFFAEGAPRIWRSLCEGVGGVGATGATSVLLR